MDATVIPSCMASERLKTIKIPMVNAVNEAAKDRLPYCFMVLEKQGDDGVKAEYESVVYAAANNEEELRFLVVQFINAVGIGPVMQVVAEEIQTLSRDQ